MIDAVIFDKDGTLFDFRRTWGVWSARLLADLAGGDAARALDLGRAIGFDPLRQTFAPDSPVIADTAETVARYLLPRLPGADLAGLVAQMNALAERVEPAEVVPLAPLLAGLRGRGL